MAKKTAVDPAGIVRLAGCWMIAGAVCAMTEKVTMPSEKFPSVSVTRTVTRVFPLFATGVTIKELPEIVAVATVGLELAIRLNERTVSELLAVG